MAYAWQPLPLATSLGKSASGFAASMELRNLYAKRKPQGERRPFELVHTPGLVTPMEAAGVVSAMAYNGALFWVQGNKAYIYDDGDETEIDDLDLSNLPARMCAAGITPEENVPQVLVAASQQGTFLVDSTTVTEITHPEEAGFFCDVGYLNGRSIFVDPVFNRVYVSAIDDPTTIGALSFTVPDAVSDLVAGVAVCKQEVALIGQRHTEFWYDAGAFPFPLARSPSGVIPVGTYSTRTIVADDAIYMLDHNLIVRRFAGYQPERISTDWVERLIKQTLASFTAGHVHIASHMHVFGGSAFYGLSVPGATADLDLNLFFDIAEGTWHRRDNATGEGDITTFIGFATGKAETTAHVPPTFAATRQGIYRLSETAYRDDGAEADKPRVIVCPEHDADGRTVFEGACELAMERTDDVEGTVEYEFSDDGGDSYFSMGEVPTDQVNKGWHECGSYEERRLRRFTVLANHRIAIDGLRGLLEVGS
jgi:hypothetical protein